MNPQDQQGFTNYRTGIAHADLPALRPGMQHNSALLITLGIRSLTAEQHLARQEAATARADRAAPKTPQGQVPWEADLPPIYEKIANARKGKV
jgi:hypothetical protein